MDTYVLIIKLKIVNRISTIYRDLFENPMGRITRGDFWLITLFQTITYVLIALTFSEDSIILLFVTLYLLISGPIFQIKRYHDSGHKGWWIFVPIANFFFLFYNSTEDNKWGLMPQKGEANNE